MMACTKQFARHHDRPCSLCCTEIKNLEVTLGRAEILYDVNFHVHCGELTAIIGPNGAGKSTLLKAILEEIPYRGELCFVNHKGENGKRPLIGYVPQRLDFDPGAPISVQDLFLVSMTRKPVWLLKLKNFRERVTQDLNRVRAGHLIDKRLGDLSGGELQRVLLALALDPIPELLLLDEPVSGIDQPGMEMFYNVVSEIKNNYDLSIMLVSHDLNLVSQHADRVVFINRTVLYSGSVEGFILDNDLANHQRSAWLRGLGLGLKSGIRRASRSDEE